MSSPGARVPFFSVMTNYILPDSQHRGTTRVGGEELGNSTWIILEERSLWVQTSKRSRRLLEHCCIEWGSLWRYLAAVSSDTRPIS